MTAKKFRMSSNLLFDPRDQSEESQQRQFRLSSHRLFNPRDKGEEHQQRRKDLIPHYSVFLKLLSPRFMIPDDRPHDLIVTFISTQTPHARTSVPAAGRIKQPHPYPDTYKDHTVGG